MRVNILLWGALCTLSGMGTSTAWMCPIVKHNGEDARPTEAQPDGEQHELTCTYSRGKDKCVYEKKTAKTAHLIENKSTKKFPCADKIH